MAHLPELSGTLRLSGSFAEVFLGVGDSHFKGEQFAERRKRIRKELIAWG